MDSSRLIQVAPRSPTIGCALVFVALMTLPISAAPTGEEVYKTRCSGCHDQVNERVPPKDALRKMPAARIVHALDSGAMMAIAFRMNREDRISVASYLGTKDEAHGPPASSFCRDRTIKLSAAPAGWNGWSVGTANARFQSPESAGLNIDAVRRLKLKWAFGFDGDVTAFAAPTVLDGYLFVGSAAGIVHAMHAESGCLHWVYQANGPVRTAMTVAPLNGGSRHALLFGDMTGWFYALEAETGKLLWKAHVEEHDSTRLTGGSVAHNGVVYVPVASWEETRAADDGYPCCTFRGSVVAMNIADGKRLWKTYMVDEPHQTGTNPRGEPMMGPSGAGVWSAPTIDEKRGVLYVATGDNYSKPATDLSDSVVALDLKTGRVIWSKQITSGDVYSGGCRRNQEECGPDFDFGSSAILVSQNGGKQLLLAGQKSGVVNALDPDKKGEIVWQTRVGIGGTNGGVQWGMATDGEFVYAAVSDLARMRNPIALSANPIVDDPSKGGGLAALRVADGSKVWRVEAAPCPAGSRPGCSPAQPGALTGIPGAIFSGSIDGHIRAFAAESGSVLWDFDTATDFVTVNGATAHGGSIDGPGAVVVKGMVFVNSGYPRNGGMPGNVLLAFTPQ
jgi:polyvinyl alcohol dehydrogenase (cytochrome)